MFSVNGKRTRKAVKSDTNTRQMIGKELVHREVFHGILSTRRQLVYVRAFAINFPFDFIVV